MKSIKYFILLASILGVTTTRPMGAFNWCAQKYRDYKVIQAIKNSNLSSFTHSFDKNDYNSTQLNTFLEKAKSIEERRSADKRDNKNNTYSIPSFFKGTAKSGVAFTAGLTAISLLCIPFISTGNACIETSNETINLANRGNNPAMAGVALGIGLLAYVGAGLAYVAEVLKWGTVAGLSYGTWKSGKSGLKDFRKSYNYCNYVTNKKTEAQSIKTQISEALNSNNNDDR